MQADYKIIEEREVAGEIIYQRVRFFSGSLQMVDVYNPITEQTTQVHEYVRTTILDEVEFTYG